MKSIETHTSFDATTFERFAGPENYKRPFSLVAQSLRFPSSDGGHDLRGRLRAVSTGFDLAIAKCSEFNPGSVFIHLFGVAGGVRACKFSCSRFPRKHGFHIDRPCAFAIRDDATGTLLFVGVVRNLE